MATTLFDQYDPEKEEMLQLLDAEGNLNENYEQPFDDKELLRLYKVMRLCRTMDLKAVVLQRQGRIALYVPTAGQEASVIGAASTLNDDDWIVPAFREMPAQVLRGIKLSEILLWQKGDEQAFLGMTDKYITPVAVPVASQTLHAAGLAWAHKIKGDSQIAMGFVGDGGTSEGDFHECQNFAGVFKLPLITIIQNNQWGISTPRSLQTASRTLAQKAVAYGIPGVLVDGNDLFAMHLASRTAVKRARSGEGATLIESFTYRMGAHTTADDPTRYRTKEEEESWKPKDPMTRLKKYMIAKGIWDDEQEAVLDKECEEEVEREVDKLQHISYDKDSIFKYHFKEMTPDLIEQEKEYKNFLKLEGKD